MEFKPEFTAHIKSDKKQSCEEHCRNTAYTAGLLLSAIGLEKTAYLSGLLHDMGKFHNNFNTYIEAVSSGKEYVGEKVIHTFTGVSYILQKYHKKEDSKTRRLTAEIIALAIGSHHGLLDIYKEENDYNEFEHRIIKQPEYDREAVFNFRNGCASESEINDLFEKSEKEIAEISAKIRKISNASDFSDTYFYSGLLARLVSSAVVEGDRRDTANFMAEADRPYEKEVKWQDEINSLEKRLEAFSSNSNIAKARKSFSDACKGFATKPTGIYRLSLPTGGGKTLSALRFALHHAANEEKRRVFYVAPLLTILEQNARVIKDAMPEDADILQHYSDVIDSCENDELLDNRELYQESWENKIIITTLVQMLYTMFSGKMSSVRRFNSLSNSIIIFDEVQSLPLKVYSMFNLMINFLSACCNTTVILCSATLPDFKSPAVQYKMNISEQQMISKELIANTKNVFKRTNIKKQEGLNFEEVSRELINRLESVKSILCVCNKKAQARDLFNQLKCEAKVQLFHLSAGMCSQHRRDVLRALTKALRSGKKVICVATQIIEAGIDISFECVYRFAAGLDSVVQSAGRCNRNAESFLPGDVYILPIKDEKLKGLEDIRKQKEAIINLLYQYDEYPEKFENDLVSENAIKYYYAVFLNEQKDVMNYLAKDGKHTLLSYLSANKSIATDSVYNKKAKEYIFGQSFRTAGKEFEVFDNNQISVVVPYNERAKGIIAALYAEGEFGRNQKLLKKIKDYTVSIFKPELERLEKIQAIKRIPGLEIPVLSKDYYSDETGVLKEEKEKCNIL